MLQMYCSVLYGDDHLYYSVSTSTEQHQSTFREQTGLFAQVWAPRVLN